MDLKYYQEMSSDERREMLEADALEKAVEKYTRPLSDDEVRAFKDQLANASIHQATMLDEFKEVKKEWKERLDEVGKSIKESLFAVKYRATHEEGVLYKMADYDNHLIYYIDEHGNVINSRPMLPDERQLTIRSLKTNAQ